MTPGIAWRPDDEFLIRVKRAYRLSLEGWRGVERSMWSGIFRRQQPVHDALLADDNDVLRAIFSNPGATDLFYGVDNLSAEYIAELKRNDDARRAAEGEAEYIFQYSLPQAMGCAGGSFEPFEAALSQRIEFPNPFADEFGVETSRGLASYRALHALYQASRIVETMHGGSVIEIGPGAGRTAYYAFKSGHVRYTTLDLPMGVVAQSCFLGATLGPDRIWLSGDAEHLAEGRIRLLPASLGLPEEPFDLVVNVDSMTEMGPHAALGYARWIAGHAPRFLSINHTDNPFTIDDVCRMAFASYRITRRAYPLRPGYSEDLIEPGPPRAAWLATKWMDAALLSRRIQRRLADV